ncbi:hypothetical protein D3C72_1010020 [compost metagenome]
MDRGRLVQGVRHPQDGLTAFAQPDQRTWNRAIDRHAMATLAGELDIQGPDGEVHRGEPWLGCLSKGRPSPREGIDGQEPGHQGAHTESGGSHQEIAPADRFFPHSNPLSFTLLYDASIMLRIGFVGKGRGEKFLHEVGSSGWSVSSSSVLDVDLTLQLRNCRL